jgi:hypothetical protein
MSIASVPSEVETVTAFVNAGKRDRYAAFLSNEKRRKDFVRDLAHFDDFDPRFIVRIAPTDQSPAGVEALLLKKGAGNSCHVISEWSSIDGREMNLLEALKETIGRDMGTILCCKSGKLAYFENEDQRFILEHPSNKGTK